MSDICAAELDALSPFELELVARALQLRQPLTAAALSARLASLSAQQQSTQLVSCVFSLADCDSDGVTTRELEADDPSHARRRSSVTAFMHAQAEVRSSTRDAPKWLDGEGD